jgi:polysaccharide deacetylase 2 family uncharacterized protein YibQ
VRDAFWIGLIVAALLAIGGGYAQGILSARPPPVAALRAARSESHVLPAVARERRLDGETAANDGFAGDDVVVDRPRPPAAEWRRGQLAVFVGLCGTSVAAESGFLRLGQPFAFIVDAHAPQARAFAQLVRDGGDELFVQIAQAPSQAEIAAVRRVVGTFDGVAGRDAAGVAAALRGTGLGYFDERGDADPQPFAAAGVPLVRRDVTADDRSGTGYIAFMFAQAAAISRRTGTVTVLVRPLPATLNALRRLTGAQDTAIVAPALR